jgi:hypothetical protein
LGILTLKNLKSERLQKIKWERGVAAFAGVIIAMQTSGVISALPGYTAFEFSHSYLSYDGALELSQNENIIVFMPDRLDVQYMNLLLFRHPELHEQLDGFTYFRNNLSMYSNTFPSVTQMLTHEEYSLDFNNNWGEYFGRAWGRRNFMDCLRDSGYVTTLLPDGITTFGHIDNIVNHADNVETTDTSALSFKPGKILNITLRISLARVAPYLLKEPLVKGIGFDFNNAFIEGGLDSDALPYVVGTDSDMMFYNRLRSTGLSTPHTENVFTFAHFYGAHGSGLKYDSDSGTVIEHQEGGTHLDSGRAFFAILNEYITQLKDLGIYDSSTIIIITDHGSLRSAVWANGHSENDSVLLSPVSSTLLIKPRDSRGALQLDVDAELSHINFAASVLEFAGLPHSEFGESYGDIIRNGGTQTRTFNLMWWVNFGHIRPISRFTIEGDANDFDNWVEVEIEVEVEVSEGEKRRGG